MDTSIFSFIMSLIWCSIFLLFAAILRRKTDFVLKYGVSFILLILIIGIARLLLPFEPHFAIVIHATSIMPALQRFLTDSIFQIRDISISLFDIFMSIWAIGSLVYLSSIFIGISKAARRIRNLSSSYDPQVQRIMDAIILDSKPKQKYRIIISDDIASPMLVGFFAPTVLLPPMSLSDEEMRFVLLHEWNHFLHKHLWIKLLFNVLCALMWWNPLMYMIKSDLDYILEVSCDRLVVKSFEDDERLGYVESTLEVMKQLINSKPHPSLYSIGFVSTADPEKIVQRSELILFPPQKISKRIQKTLAATILGLMVASYLFIVQPTAPPPKSTNEEYISISPENSYLCPNEDGTYKLFVDGKYVDTFNPNELESKPYSSLPIKNKEDH